jgi:hypothetical protein
MASWPRYATLAEDLLLRGEKWNDEYEGERLIFWDSTSIPIPQPSCAELQRNTYSQYYKGNVAKGGVFVQPCGWSGTWDLFVGDTSDSEYMIRSGIIPHQHHFFEKSGIDDRPDKPCSSIPTR